MDDQEIMRELMKLFYMFPKENGPMMNVCHKQMRKRDVMILESILHMHPDGSPVKMSDLSDYFKVTPAAISQMIRSFEEKGWVQRVKPPHDRRTTCIQVSEQAKEHLRESLLLMQEHLRAFISLLGEEDARALVRILEKAIVFYQAQHGQDTPKKEGDRTC